MKLNSFPYSRKYILKSYSVTLILKIISQLLYLFLLFVMLKENVSLLCNLTYFKHMVNYYIYKLSLFIYIQLAIHHYFSLAVSNAEGECVPGSAAGRGGGGG